jgi:hypothetical protein
MPASLRTAPQPAVGAFATSACRADTAFALDSQAFASGRSLREIVTNVLFLQSFNLHSLAWNHRDHIRRPDFAVERAAIFRSARGSIETGLGRLRAMSRHGTAGM